ncbi:unnamed protein product [Prorocentrum cordatum]|uniref:Uncharacterized protein n=1 Tax=Prorocentrum cordatum TaxID=2364126 RepID=A0ABN9TDQ4_9DINO|nr:unnamed protein product [Polarella glacialis]
MQRADPLLSPSTVGPRRRRGPPRAPPSRGIELGAGVLLTPLRAEAGLGGRRQQQCHVGLLKNCTDLSHKKRPSTTHSLKDDARATDVCYPPPKRTGNNSTSINVRRPAWTSESFRSCKCFSFDEEAESAHRTAP